MPISLLNGGGAVGSVVQAFSGVNFFANQAKTRKIKIGQLEKVELISGDNESKPSPRKWSIFNQGPDTVFLFYGEEKEHGHPLPPGVIFTSDDSGGLGNKVSALSEGEALVRVTLRDVSHAEGEEEVPAPLKVKPFAPTGSERPQEVIDSLQEQGLPLDDLTTIGQSQINGILDSDDGLTGFKFFELCSFEVGQPYEFSVRLDPDFQRSYLSDYLQLPVKCWALNQLKAVELRLQVACNQINPSKVNILNQAWRVKQWIGVSLDRLPNTFTIVPDYSTRHFGLWAVDTRTDYENCLVWRFDPENNEFIILGF